MEYSNNSVNIWFKVAEDGLVKVAGSPWYTGNNKGLSHGAAGELSLEKVNPEMLYCLTFECHSSFPDVCFLLKEVKQLWTMFWWCVVCDAAKQQCNQYLGEL